MRYTKERKEELLRLFKERTITIREFSRQHKIALSILYKWQKDATKKRLYDVNQRDVQHLQTRVEFLENAVKILHGSAIFQNATLKDKLLEMKRLNGTYSVHCLSFAYAVTRGTFYNDLLRAKGEDAWFQKRRSELEPIIREIHEQSHGSYGADKIAATMRLRGTNTSPATVASIMREIGVESNRNASYKAYKNARSRYKAELREREARFTETAPDKLWVCDVSEIFLGHAKIFLCVIIDVFSRKVVGWRIGQSNCTRLVKATFLIAYAERKPTQLTFHSDRGSPNVSRRLFDCLRVHGVTPSYSRPYTPTDNPVVESFFRNLKSELVYPCKYESVEALIRAIGRYMNAYNALRPHEFLQNKTPNSIEEEYWAKTRANRQMKENQGGSDRVG